jgi:hypothetical protein
MPAELPDGTRYTDISLVTLSVLEIVTDLITAVLPANTVYKVAMVLDSPVLTKLVSVNGI